MLYDYIMEIATLFLKNWGASGLLAMCIILILFGKLVPRTVVEDITTDRDKWREIAMNAVAQSELLATLNAQVSNIEDTTKHNEQMLSTMQSNSFHRN